MKNKKTYYLLILDRSGSMCSCADETISGFNEQVQMIRDLQRRYPDQEFRISLTTFNHTIDHLFDTMNVEKIKELNSDSYIPTGSTALLDAIGSSVIRLKHAIQDETEADLATAVIVILTDGMENSSKEFKLPEIGRLINELQETGKWTFSFLGTTKEAILSAQEMNISRQNTAIYAPGRTKETFSHISGSIISYADRKSKGEKIRDFLNNDL